MLGAKVFGAGLPGLAVQAICQDAASALAAAGTTQGTATELTSAVNALATVASGAGVILASTGTPGDSQIVFNGGANAVKVYPPSGAKINGLSTNGSMLLQTNTACEFWCVTSTLWIGVLSA